MSFFFLVSLKSLLRKFILPLFPPEKLDDLKQELELDVHVVEASELCERFSTNLDKGLTTEQAKKNIEEYGPNALTPPKTTPEWVKFCKNLFSGFAMYVFFSFLKNL